MNSISPADDGATTRRELLTLLAAAVPGIAFSQASPDPSTSHGYSDQLLQFADELSAQGNSDAGENLTSAVNKHLKASKAA